jgi:hypothetical protein
MGVGVRVPLVIQGKKMTEQEILDLEIEKRACIATANELCRGDGYMESARREIIDALRAKAKEIEKKLNVT